MSNNTEQQIDSVNNEKELVAVKVDRPIEYENRDRLDEELGSALSDILSAEEQARRIIEQAGLSVKALQLDHATRERNMREVSEKAIASARGEALARAAERATAECRKRVAEAEEKGKTLISAKKKEIDICIKNLYGELGGKA